MENGSTSNTGPLINPAKLSKLALSKQQFAKRRKVVLSNLPDVLDVEELKKKLLKGYDVDDVKLENDAVTVLFSNAEQAETANKGFYNKTFHGHTIKTEFVQPDSLLFVGNLPLEFSEEQFEALMSQYGSIERIFLVRSEITGESKGYGFVEYSTKELAGQAKQSLMNTGSKYIGGRILRVDFAEPNLSTYDDLHSKTLFVDKLPRDFTNGDLLRDIFSRTGTVTFAQVAINNQTGASRGFAFVDYATSDDAEKGQRAHNGVQIEGSNIRVAYGTPGRTGASILGIQLVNNISQVPNQVPLIQAGSPTARGPASQWSAQPMSSSVPHPLMPRPLMAHDPRPQNIGLIRGPAARFPMPLIAPGSPVQVCNPRAAMFARPMMRRDGAGIIAMGSPPQRPFMGVSQARGPRPLMAEIPFRGVGPRPGGPRGLCPRGVMPMFDPRCAVSRNGPVRPLMDLNSCNGNILAQQPVEERLEPNQAFAPQMVQVPQGSFGIQPVNNQIQPHQQPQQLQPLMQPQQVIQQQHQQQPHSQQQRLMSPHLQSNPQPQQMQQAPPQPLMPDFRPSDVQPPQVMPPQPLLGQPIGGLNVGGPTSGPMAGPIAAEVEPTFEGHGLQAAHGPVPLLGPGNQEPEYQMTRPQSMGRPVPLQGQEFRHPTASLPANQSSPVKTFLPQPVPQQLSVSQPGSTPMMAVPSQTPWAGQQAPQFSNGTQGISSQAPSGQYGVPSQPMTPPQPLMQQMYQTPNQLTAPQVLPAQRPVVAPIQQDPNVQYQNFGIQQQGPVSEQVVNPFMADQVQPQQQQTGYTPQSQEIQQGVQPAQQPLQQPVPVQQQLAGYPQQPGQGVQPQQQIYQPGPMPSATPSQWVQPAGNAQQPTPLMHTQAFQVPPAQQDQQLHNTGQQWRPVQQPAVQPQPFYGQFQQEPQQMFSTQQQQFQTVFQPVDPNYQQQQQLQISATNTSTPSPIPQHSAAPVMYNTQASPTDPNQHGQKRPLDQQLGVDQSYMNQPHQMQGMGEFYDANKRPRF